MNLAAQEDDMEIQANILGSAILMPMAQVKRAFYRMRAGRGRDALDNGYGVIVPGIQAGHAGSGWQTII